MTVPVSASGGPISDERLAELLREEWEALGLMSYHGGLADGIWFADLGPEDIGKIRALLHESAAELSRLRAVLTQQEEALSEIEARCRTRRVGLHMDGTSKWATPFIGEIYDLAHSALHGGSV